MVNFDTGLLTDQQWNYFQIIVKLVCEFLSAFTEPLSVRTLPILVNGSNISLVRAVIQMDRTCAVDHIYIPLTDRKAADICHAMVCKVLRNMFVLRVVHEVLAEYNLAMRTGTDQL